MKLYLLLFVCIIISSSTSAQIGCKIGNYILTTPNGATYQNGSDRIPVYIYNPGNSNTISKRNWDKDPQCGIMRGVADGYPNANGTANNPNAKCSPSNNYGDIGQLVVYKVSDNSCITSVPLDDYLYFLVIGISLIGYYAISFQSRRFNFSIAHRKAK